MHHPASAREQYLQCRGREAREKPLRQHVESSLSRPRDLQVFSHENFLDQDYQLCCETHHVMTRGKSFRSMALSWRYLEHGRLVVKQW